MKKAHIEDGYVTNIIIVDPDNIPDWCSDWPDAYADTAIGSTYADGVFTLPQPPESTLEELAAALVLWRATAKCSPMQGKLALGQTEWAKIESYRDNEATWAEKVVIDSAQEWRRNSQDIQFFGYLLGYTDEQMDALFQAAMQIDA